MKNPEPNHLHEHNIAPAAVQLQDAHHHETSRSQHAVDRLTAAIGSPRFLVLLTGAIASWISSNVLVGLVGMRPPDPPPFFWLQGMVTTGALYTAVLILSSQRRRDQLDSHRSQVILELAILNDQKVSKVVELLGESRRDHPLLVERFDAVAQAMAVPSDPSSVLDAVKSMPPVERNDGADGRSPRRRRKNHGQ